MNKDDSKQVCTNCKHYKQHYIISSGAFMPIHKGHCTHAKTNIKISAKHVDKDEGCELWQSYELQKLEQQYMIEQKLADIHKKVWEMLEVLRNIE